MVALFFATGIVAEFVQIGVTHQSTIGASGAIMGLWGWCVIDTWGTIHPFTGPPQDKWVGVARIGAIGMVVLSIADIIRGGSWVGDYAHMTGLLAGAVLGLFVRRRPRAGYA